jgi:hypothetical protein
VDGDEEQPPLVRRVGWADDGGVPVEDVVVRARARAARRGRVLLEILLQRKEQGEEAEGVSVAPVRV